MRRFIMGVAAWVAAASGYGLEKPNVVIFFADDISAREIPVYGSTVWTQPGGGDTQDVEYRAKTPVLDRLAAEGCHIKTVWAATVCMPSRAMMMTGRYAHLHKWWVNGDQGKYRDTEGRLSTWPLYESSPILIGHVAQQAGYGTFWAGKTQMPGDMRKYGFDEACFTPGNESGDGGGGGGANPYTDFKTAYKKVDGNRVLVNYDTGKEIPWKSYPQDGWYWHPNVQLMNHPSSKEPFAWWPNTPEAKGKFGINTYGPDVELQFVFDFMERQHKAGKPFFVYHCSHLGHDAYDWFNPQVKNMWPGTPIVKWDGKGYTRTEPKVKGDEGKYGNQETITGPGIHNHINYIDYQVWLYQRKFADMGIAGNTVFIFCADNGTWSYGKHNVDRQKGCHVPMIIYAPGMTKHGEQDILVNLADILPTLADIAGFKLPSEYEINGQSLWPYLTTHTTRHRDWIYAYQGSSQLIRGERVLNDGNGRWWDVTSDPSDLIGFKQITDWGSVPETFMEERRKLEDILPKFDLYETEHDAPGVPSQPPRKNKGDQASAS